MDAPAPFTHATPSSCRMAWTGGVCFPPEWRFFAGILAIDTAGFHALIRAAGLPLSELRRMGFRDTDLSERSGYTYTERAAVLLGRIAWDAKYGDQGARWQDHPSERLLAQHMGEAVIRAWFSS